MTSTPPSPPVTFPYPHDSSSETPVPSPTALAHALLISPSFTAPTVPLSFKVFHPISDSEPSLSDLS